ncbi:hypothetical protein [Methylobacterium radiotolerans]|uniref:Uncharacterized protein n=1 Tax=Methylobacterium radiotolerans (strain ATCC 27329 / DSM 1819 / JCM 2831 / NBRC 15690 / NCIMB 10815 / 0-1) TaxID=426355 RepID=B1LW81_METRJ|nr:hypothetical protein [Methylobacterium radiotolerans]ACB27144.1 hypothetical protein Mrad2831_5187 [Methylobacterium radiotolerans JCM 2831]
MSPFEVDSHPLKVAVSASQPHHLRALPLGRAEARLRVAAVLKIRVAVNFVEGGHEVVDGIES